MFSLLRDLNLFLTIDVGVEITCLDVIDLGSEVSSRAHYGILGDVYVTDNLDGAEQRTAKDRLPQG